MKGDACQRHACQAGAIRQGLVLRADIFMGSGQETKGKRGVLLLF